MKKILKEALIKYYYGCENEPTTEKEAIKWSQKQLVEEWGEGADKGYAIFVEDNDFKEPMLVIERLDDLMVYGSDIEAAKQAKRDGIKLIEYFDYPYRTYPFNCYRFVDTVENREALSKNIRLMRN